MRNIVFALVFIMTISFGYEPSKELIKLASEGNVSMQNFVASTYAHKKDYEKAFFWYEKAAMQQNDFAQYRLADIYYNVRKDYKKAIFWYEKAAMQQHALAQYSLADMYYDLKKDYGKAFFWYEKAANNGFELAQIKLLNSYKYGDKGVVKDLEISSYWNERFDSTSKLNYIMFKPSNPEEQFNVGVNSFDKKNYAYALYLFKEAARSGQRDSQYNVGVMFYYGIGVLKDIDTASYWLEKAASQGDNKAKELLKDINQLNIKEAKKISAKLQENSSKTKENQLYKKACDGGDVKACVFLGLSYANGEGVAKDLSKASQLYKKACDGGYAQGCAFLGLSYANGEGVAKDLSKANKLFKKACDSGIADGCEALKIINQK